VYQQTSRDKSTVCIRRDLKGELHISIRDNKNLGLRGTKITPVAGNPTSLSPAEWIGERHSLLSTGTASHSKPGTASSLQISPVPDSFPSEETEKSSTLEVVFPDSWIGGPAGANPREIRHRYRRTITVSARGNLHPNAIDLLLRTVMFCALQQQLANLFDDLFQHIVD